MGGPVADAARAPRPGETPLDLWVAGHTNLDHLLKVRELPASDRTVPILARETRLGGTAANIARAAAGAGVRVGLLSQVGSDFPASFRAALETEKVDLRGLESVAASPSSACFIAEDGKGGQFTFIDQGPFRDEGGWSPAERLLGEASWIHLTTGPPKDLLRLKESALARGLRVAVDPAQEVHYRWTAASLRELLEGAEILFGNAAEVRRAAELLERPSPESLVDLVPLVVVTRGAEGAESYSRVGVTRVPTDHSGPVAQVTGAGDAFRGGFYAAWFQGKALEPALHSGIRAASRWIRAGGPVGSGGSRSDG